MSIKTIEFKLSLNNTQKTQIDRWLRAQQRVWNIGLEILKEFEQFTTYNTQDKAYAPCCPVPWQYRWVPLNPDTEWRDPAIVASLPKKDKLRTNYLPIPFSPITVGREAYPCCPVPRAYQKPRIQSDSFYGIVPWFAYKLHPDWDWLLQCPYKITQTTLKELATAWTEYKKRKRDIPRFKSRKFPMRTLSNAQSGNAKLLGNDRIKLPGIEKPVLVRGVDDRFLKYTDKVNSYRIVKEPSGYYLLLVGDLPFEIAKPSAIAGGLDAGIVHLLTDDDGKHIEFPGSLEKQLKRLKLLQQKAARQQDSKRKQKTLDNIRRLHEKIRRNRKAYHHKVTAYAVRKYGAIAVEALNLSGMTKAPKAKPSADGTHYEKNGASAKATLNRRLLDAGIGKMYSMLEQKCLQNERIFVRVNPKNTSRTCNKCGHTEKGNRISQSEFKCISCGYTNNADVNAAKNIRDKAFSQGRTTPV